MSGSPGQSPFAEIAVLDESLPLVAPFERGLRPRNRILGEVPNGGGAPFRAFLALDDGPGDLRALDLLAVLDESLHLVHELGDVLELAVDRREPDIRDL